MCRLWVNKRFLFLTVLVVLIVLGCSQAEPEVVEVTVVVETEAEEVEVVVTQVVVEEVEVEGEVVEVEATRIVEAELPPLATGSERPIGPIPTAAPVAGSSPAGSPNPTATPDPAEQFVEFRADPGISTEDETVSTFGLDVDDSSYQLAKSYLVAGELPPTSTVRIEEFVNAFAMGYPAPPSSPLGLTVDGAPSPYSEDSFLLRIGVQGQERSRADLPPLFLVFVVDVSGSMALDGKLLNTKTALLRLASLLRPEDQVAIIAYHETADVSLPPTLATDQTVIINAIEGLRTQGTSSAEAGLAIAYDVAVLYGGGRQTEILLFSDGVTNVGSDVAADIVDGAAQDVRLHTFGLGEAPEGDALMNDLALQGNGSYARIDEEAIGNEHFLNTLPASLHPIALNAAIQVDFNPDSVSSFRLLGYEDRVVEGDAFREESVFGGELGSGHAVTALYEIHLQPDSDPSATAVVITLRYTDVDNGSALEQVETFRPEQFAPSIAGADPSLRLATAAAHLALWLRSGVGNGLIAPLTDELVALTQLDDVPAGALELAELFDLAIGLRQP